MFWLRAVCAIAVASVNFFGASVANAATAPAAWGSAYVTTLPASAEVWVDGIYAGHAPVFLDLLAPGRHAVTISRAGWSPKLAAFSVGAGQIVSVSITLDRSRGSATRGAFDRERGHISVRGNPAGAPVFIDGIKAGVLPTAPKQLSAGRHIVVVKPKNGAQLTHAIVVYPDTLTVALFSNAQSTGAIETQDVLAPLDKYVPSTSYSTAGNEIAIHYRGVEVECAVGSRMYTFNGRPGALDVAPAIVQGKFYLPMSLLQRIIKAR